MEDTYLNFIRLLNEQGIEYVVIGGHAVIVHGYVRTTTDLDLLIATSTENADRMLTVMLRFGFGPYDFEWKDFTQKPGGVSFDFRFDKIEILTQTLGITFEESYQNRIVVEFRGVPVNFLNLHDLVANKRAVGRPKDFVDLDNLPQPD